MQIMHAFLLNIKRLCDIISSIKILIDYCAIRIDCLFLCLQRNLSIIEIYPRIKYFIAQKQRHHSHDLAFKRICFLLCLNRACSCIIMKMMDVAVFFKNIVNNWKIKFFSHYEKCTFYHYFIIKNVSFNGTGNKFKNK